MSQKRCGHLDNKELISKDEMVKKIKTVSTNLKDSNFLIIARTDANSVEGLGKTIERVKKTGEMLYNKKEQLEHDLNKPKSE